MQRLIDKLPKASAIDLMIATVALFILLLAGLFSIHGFSINMWSHHLGLVKSAATELLGHAVPIRSDDWVVGLPYIFAQIKAPEPFSVVNDLVFGGQNMLAMTTPIQHLSTLFRPSVWGYFVGPDFGMGFQWAFRSLGLILSVYFFSFWNIETESIGGFVDGGLFSL